MLKIVGYSDRLSVRPGEAVAFKVSCEADADAYDAEIVRLICGDDSPGGPGFKAEPVAASVNGRYPGRKQRVNAGSFGLVSNPIGRPAEDGMTLAAMIFPTWLEKHAEQTILACQSAETRAGWRLMLDPAGRPRFEVSDGERVVAATIERPAPERRWSLLIATIDGSAKTVGIVHRLLAPSPGVNAVETATRPLPFPVPDPGDAPLTIAAALDSIDGERLFTTSHFDGKIEAPVIAALVRQPEAMQSVEALNEGCHARWDFSVGIDSQDACARERNPVRRDPQLSNDDSDK